MIPLRLWGARGAPADRALGAGFRQDVLRLHLSALLDVDRHEVGASVDPFGIMSGLVLGYASSRSERKHKGALLCRRH